ncbi:MAG TPA: protein phosphatase CheZ [Alphaproteobacteria bacterium]|nr:protein phosphatase CheZ [Alphaproteobacteria bacterium]
MDEQKVSEGIERLVDHLRAQKDSPISLADIACVTEVLLATMRRYFNAIDISIYGELRSLAEHIQKARTEIAELRPADISEEKIPRAGKELEAIVQATEQATGTIMDAAEEIMATDAGDAEAYQQAVTDACMRIFEACSFQDITGQRITKVVNTLTFIEDRLNRIQAAWGPALAEAGIEPAPAAVANGEDDEDDEARLLNGPALEGEGIDQSEVDSLLADKTANGKSKDAASGNGKAKTKAPARKPAAEATPPANAAEAPLPSGGEVSQAEIDALFD